MAEPGITLYFVLCKNLTSPVSYMNNQLSLIGSVLWYKIPFSL